MDMLATVPFNVAQSNLREHILSNQYPPTIADIAHDGPEEMTDPEIYYRNKQIAHQQFVAAGGEPEDFVYEPRGNPRLKG